LVAPPGTQPTSPRPQMGTDVSGSCAAISAGASASATPHSGTGCKTLPERGFADPGSPRTGPAHILSRMVSAGHVVRPASTTYESRSLQLPVGGRLAHQTQVVRHWTRPAVPATVAPGSPSRQSLETSHSAARQLAPPPPPSPPRSRGGVQNPSTAWQTSTRLAAWAAGAAVPYVANGWGYEAGSPRAVGPASTVSRMSSADAVMLGGGCSPPRHVPLPCTREGRSSSACSRSRVLQSAPRQSSAVIQLSPQVSPCPPHRAVKSLSSSVSGCLTETLQRASTQDTQPPMQRQLSPVQAVIVTEAPPDQQGAELAPGATVLIGEVSFEVVSPIGEGTFGVVWGARCQDGSNVAIKEIYCNSQNELSDAVYEGQILQALGKTQKDSGPEVARVPLFVACSAERVAPEEWRMRLAMTHIPGESLNRFLERRKTEGKPWERFREAGRFAQALIDQLGPAFARISELVYHRDVNPRNILVEERLSPGGGPSELRYGLIDFGLAVDAAHWRLGAAQGALGEAVVGAWQVFGVGGDCRYWPVSAWLMLERGPRALCARPQLSLEYKMHLDLHALGVTALQVLADLSPEPPLQDAESSGNPALDEACAKLWVLCDAWERYWADVSAFWRRLFDAYRRTGDHSDLATVKAEYRNVGVHSLVGDGLRAIRIAIREAGEACERLPPDSGLGAVPVVLHVLLVMISSGEDSARSSWRRVEFLVQSGASSAKNTTNGATSMRSVGSPGKATRGALMCLSSAPGVPTASTASPASGSAASQVSQASVPSASPGPPRIGLTPARPVLTVPGPLRPRVNGCVDSLRMPTASFRVHAVPVAGSCANRRHL